MNQLRTDLYHESAKWDETREGRHGTHYPFTTLLDEVLFHGDLRFSDYKHFEDEDGAFVPRLAKWIANLDDPVSRQTLLWLAARLTFVDHSQIRSLYRDGYRRVIVPWLTPADATPSWFLAPSYDKQMTELLANVELFSITTSFDFNVFRSVNGLAGIKKPTILTEFATKAKALLAHVKAAPTRVVVFEDFVGSGNQCARILRLVRGRFTESEILCIPLIILEKGLLTLQEDDTLRDIHIQPVLVVPQQECIERERQTFERTGFAELRKLIEITKDRVLERFNNLDDVPDNEFGYNEGGGLIVTSHNAPNNTIALIHHRAPSWNPLFRRLHHSYT